MRQQTRSTQSRSAAASDVYKRQAPNGEKVWEQTTTVLPLGTNPLFETTIKNPILWSPDQPQLYTCELTLTTPQSKQTITESIGFRHFEFIENGPFQLNGERLLLRGTHRLSLIHI